MTGSSVRLLVVCLAVLFGTALHAGLVEAQQEPPGPPPQTGSGLPVIIRVVKTGEHCQAAAPSPPGLPAILAGDAVTLCLSGPLPDGVTPGVTLSGPILAAAQDDSGGPTRVLGAAGVGGGLAAELPQQLAPGEYRLRVTATTDSGTAQPLPTEPHIRIYAIPAPVLTNISPRTITRGAKLRVSGQGFLAPAHEIKLLLGAEELTAERVAADGTWFVATVPAAPARVIVPTGAEVPGTGGQRLPTVYVWGIPAPPAEGITEDAIQVTVQQPVSDHITALIAVLAAAPLLLVTGLVWLLFRQRQRLRSPVVAPVPLLHGLLVEPESETYSLSRTQFYWWLAIIAYAYAFIFIGHGLIHGSWSFPPLGGFAATLLISGGTLLVAEGTSLTKGRKGSGVVHPTPSDLIVHGGVVAPERVQQVLWTVLGSAAFLWIVITTYHRTTNLPEIPTELLTLMGISSVGYLGGKLVRRPGPIIKQVLPDQDPESGGFAIRIYGTHLWRDATVTIGGTEQAKCRITARRDDGDDRNFVSELLVCLADRTLDWWQSERPLVVVENADGQRSEWRGAPPAPAEARAAEEERDTKPFTSPLQNGRVLNALSRAGGSTAT